MHTCISDSAYKPLGMHEHRRIFWRCPKPASDGQCSFFQWDDEPPRASPSASIGNSGGAAAYGNGAGGASPGAKTGGGSSTCFACGQARALL